MAAPASPAVGCEERGGALRLLPPPLLPLTSCWELLILGLRAVQVGFSQFSEKKPELRRFPSCSVLLWHSGGGWRLAVGGGGVASLLKGLISVAGPVNRVSISDGQNVRILLHIFVFSLQPDEPAHVCLSHSAAEAPRVFLAGRGATGGSRGLSWTQRSALRCSRLCSLGWWELSSLDFGSCCFRLETP